MSDKVWVINEPQGQHRTAARASDPSVRKNPALAFSLSLLFWGAGQLYNRQRVLGIFFILMMANFYAILSLAVLYWEFIASSLRSVVASSQIFGVCGALYFSGLVLWASGAIHAYYKATKRRTVSFQGIENRLLPPLCSFLIPGWGQFLNGQPKKGGCFLLFALAGHFVLSAFLFTLLLWPVVDNDMDRFLLERVLAIAIVLSPVIFLMWGFGIYDALRVGLDPVKKEPFRKRIEYAINRFRMKGWKNGVAPRVKLNFMLSLFLVLSLTVSYYYFPRRDYVVMLKNLQSQLSNQKMVLIPDLIDQFIQTISPDQPRR